MEPSEGTLLPPIKGTAAVPVPRASLWRPRSARAAPPPGVGKIKWDPYESTTKHDFVFNPATELNADCARAGTGHVIPLQVNEPTGRNTYQDEFYWKPYSKAEPIRSGSASGVRRHNPQPSERFLIWKVPREEAPLPTDSISPWTKPITVQDVEETIKKQYRTVYTGDYLGIQPGAPKDSAAPAPPDWKTLAPQPPDTEFRRHYRPQAQVPDLKDFTWKYGCNANRRIPVRGVVPSVSFANIWNQEKTKQTTTYQKDFGKEHNDIITVLNSLDPEEVKAYVERAPNPDKIILQNFLDRVNGNKKAERPSSSKKPREHPVKCM
ncbi:PREDICTED: testis-expressed sequence 26 protein isoform X1 [Gekko japonicus]|uniref:Testis-expressed sequence 26 protein isoform X1 n=1 Tax=Gekko japonicus TaxID=146911 RepID=A0ABM1L540_GEKJA|nr:PREDICTED: testis-expressed sequence 26 protein isoform X1 [Gekko japonicus]